MEPTTIVVDMLHERATKNKHRYTVPNEMAGSSPVSEIYIHKSAIGNIAPYNVRVTIEFPLRTTVAGTGTGTGTDAGSDVSNGGEAARV